MKDLKHLQYFTPYQLWLHDNTALDSRTNGIRISDVDTYIQNYRTGSFLLIEWKCRNAHIKYPQSEIIQTLHAALKHSGDKRYSGYVCIRLSGERPDDSDRIYLSGELLCKDKPRFYNEKLITHEQLTNLLQLNWR